jgi:hypothetical protein
MSAYGENLFEVYAPDASPWSAWVKPVLFAQMKQPSTRGDGSELSEPDVSWAPLAGKGSVLVVDLEGAASVAAGIALARRGYRPVPLFNGVHDSNALIDVEPIVRALEAGAGALHEMALASDAPPAFLLDARRRRGSPSGPGRFDNRWIVFPQDFPSGTLLLSHRLRDAVVWTGADARPEDDLVHVLRRWQDAGLKIRHQRSGSAGPAELAVPRPSRFRSASYRVLALLGLGRAAVGGFGTRIPVPPEGGRSGFYG